MTLTTTPTVRARLIVGLTIFLVAFGVRVLTWHDTRLEVGKVQTVVVADYQRVGRLLREGGVSSFFSRSSPLADLNNLGHPPGYSVLLAVIYSFSQSNTATQFVQVVADALSAMLIFLIVAELFPLSAAATAGLLAALSPQLAWNSVLLLPDSISVLPILLAVYLLTRAAKRPRLLTFVLIGICLGLSCWLRANAMLLTVFFATAALLLIRRKRWQFALTIICGTLLIVLPLTVRNAIVFHRFIPLSLGAGQTFLEGIADYDKENRFGIPDTDMGIMKQEAELYQRPDYYGTLFNPDGVERERARLRRGLSVIGSHPLWFAGVMAKRASSMLRLERARLLSRQPAISHSFDLSFPPIPDDEDLVVQPMQQSPKAKLVISEDYKGITLTGDDSNYGEQAAWMINGSSPVVGTRRPVHAGVDYLVRIPIKMERGRVRLSIRNARNVAFSTAVAEAIEELPPQGQPLSWVELPFVADDSEARIVISNEGAANPLARLGPIEVYGLGQSRLLWTRYPRIVIHAIQRIFITAVILPPTIIGLLMLIIRRQWSALVLMSTVPIYFLTVQSAFHTEYRYVIAVTYFVFALAGVAIGCGVDFVWRKLKPMMPRSAMMSVPSA